MQRAKREEKRNRANELKHQRATRAEQERLEQERKADAAQQSLVKSKRKSVFADLRSDLYRTLERKAPRLLIDDYRDTLKGLDLKAALRQPADWEPKGKSRETVLLSLLEHLFARYPTPKFLWSGFFSNDKKISDLVRHVANGGSMYEKVSKGDFPVTLTRKMCHEFLRTTSDYTFVSGLRRVQVRAFGGTQHLFTTWMATRIGRELQGRDAEDFWATVLSFFAKNPMIDHTQIQPLIDYIGFRRREDRAFSMKGRSVLALIRDMNRWHGDLAKERAVNGRSFEPSGFKGNDYEYFYNERTGRRRILWSVKEITTSKELAAEGSELRHCVYSYAYKIDPKGSSIWSMRANDERCVTIQVDNPSKAVVQYRDKCNAIQSAREFQILKAWADENGLSFGRNGPW